MPSLLILDFAYKKIYNSKRKALNISQIKILHK
jgi:hypothetical protein